MEQVGRDGVGTNLGGVFAAWDHGARGVVLETPGKGPHRHQITIEFFGIQNGVVDVREEGGARLVFCR